MTPALTPEQPSRTWPVSSRWFAPGVADRLLSVFTTVESGEGLGALLLSINVFLLLTAYYILKTVREALILSEGGAEVKAYASAGQAALLLAAVPVYGWLANHLTRFRLVACVMLFFLSNLPVFYALNSSGIAVGVPFYIWLGVFNLMALAQFWAFANDLYTEEQGKRLFPVIGIGSSVGALAGAWIAGAFFKALGVNELLLVAAVLIGASLLLIYFVNRRACQACAMQRENGASVLSRDGALQLVADNRYLRLIAATVVVLNVVNTGGEYLLGRLVIADATQAAIGAADPVAVKQAFIGQFYARYFAWVGVGGLLFQSFFVSRIIRRVGVRGALFFLPAIALGGYSLIAVLPALTIALTTKVFENATDYSLESTARQALFLPVSREAKYKAKTAIDTVFYRAGDLTQAGLVWVGTMLAFTTRQFALANVFFILLWLAVTALLFRTSPAPTTTSSTD